jgi:nucleotide-binding universal stress UspA family protein
MTIPYKKIMVALDGSALANQALIHAQKLADSLKADLVLFRAVEEVRSTIALSSSVDIIRESEEEIQPALIKQARKDLSKLIEQNTTLHDLKPHLAVEVGEPAQAIVDFATANQMDLIVMSTHGRTGLARLVYGSVAEQVLHRAPCPILLIRSKIE